MDTKEISDIDISEDICNILSRKNKNTPDDAADELNIPLFRVREIIERDNLFFRAAWLRYDKECDSITEAKKALATRVAIAEYLLAKTLKELDEKAG